MRLPGPVLCRLAFRLGAYQGVMAARRAEVLAEEDQAHQPAGPAPAAAAAQRGGEVKVNPGTRTALQADPAFAGIFSFGGSGG